MTIEVLSYRQLRRSDQARLKLIAFHRRACDTFAVWQESDCRLPSFGP